MSIGKLYSNTPVFHSSSSSRGLLAGNVSPVSRRVPPFYSALIKTYRRYRGADRVGPTAISDVLQQPLFGNPSILGLGGRPLYSRAMADAGMTRVLDIYSGRGWIDIANLQATHDIGASFLKGFVRKLQAAIPPIWLSLPDAMPEPPSLTISCLFKPPISISSRGMYRSIADAFDVQPIAIGQWRSTLGFAAWTSAWKSIAAARLGTPYSRDMAFKFLHRVLPTPHRLTLFDRFQDPSCPLCHHIRADLEHVFRRCPAARALRVPLRRILFSVLSYVPPTITLLSAPFLPSLSSSAAASFIVWTFVVVFWQHRLNLSLHSIIGIIAATIRRRILADWHLARRHQPTNVNFFCSQWMPPCRHSSLCLINPDETLSVRLSWYLRHPPL